MSEPTTTNLAPRRIELPGTPAPDFAPASPQQIARLQYLGFEIQEPLSSDAAIGLIDQTNNDPAFAERIEAWESEKQALHPGLFRAPPRFAGLSVPIAPAVPAEASPYAPISAPAESGYVPASGPPAFRPARRPLVKFLAVTAALGLAVLGAAGWFLWKSPGLLQSLHEMAAVGGLLLPAKAPAAVDAASKAGTAGQPLVPAKSTLPPEEFARRVAESQRQAVVRYPALGATTSEINMRFVFRYKRMLSEHDPRLQDPDWPMQLADECAVASKVKAAGSTANAPGAAGRTRSDSAQASRGASGSLHPVSSPSGS